ncbi:MAG: transglycosylase domain-containing protein [bacterium]
MSEKSNDKNPKVVPIRQRRVKNNKFVTKSGATVKIRRTLTQKSIANKEAKLARKAERLKGQPKSRIKKILWRSHPKRIAQYWFSYDGLMMALKISGVAIVIGFFSLTALFAYFRKDLPDLKDISGSNKGGSVRYYDRTGQTLLWQDYDAIKRVPVADDKISDYIKDATLSVEDRDFFKHGGFDTKGIVRAAWNNAFGGSTQGGSTITQQLVKLTNDGFEDQRTVTRKVKELILSVEMERSFTKKEILTAYLNVAPYGGIEYGVEVASQTYFHKSAKDVTLAEAAFLASMPKSPTFYSPYSPDFGKSELIARSHYILDVMADTGKISKEQRDEAKKVDVIATVQPRQPKYTGIEAPYFVLAAKNALESKYTVKNYKRGGWKVTTTLDLPKQKIAEEEVAKELKIMLASPNFYVFDTTAFVAEDVKTGQVVSLVGGADFNDKSRAGEINFAQQPLPPGSSFKPYDYLSLIENTTDFGAGSVLYDSKGPVPGYPCTKFARQKDGGDCLLDYDTFTAQGGGYPGPLTLRYALGGSRNVPAIKAMLIAGVDKTIETANKLGLKDKNGSGGYKCYADETLTTESQCYASSAIGDGAYLNLDKHVHSYATLSRNGNKIDQSYILKIEDSSNKKIYEWTQPIGEQVVRAESAYIVADMMADPNASYFSKKPHRYNGHKFSLKTGTTNDAKDGWLMGFSTQYAAGVWVGYHTRQKESRAFMETMTEPIWGNWMRRVHNELKPEERVKPAGVQTLAAYVVRKHVALGSVEPSPSTDLFPSWYQKQTIKAGQKQVFDKVSNKIASDCTPTLAIEERTDAEAAAFSGDPYVSGGGSIQDKDDVHKCEDIKPSIKKFTVSTTSVIGVYKLSVEIEQGTFAFTSDKFKGSLNFKIDGQTIDGGSLTIDNAGSFTVTYKSLFNDTKTFTAEISDSVLYSAVASSDPVTLVQAAP